MSFCCRCRGILIPILFLSQLTSSVFDQLISPAVDEEMQPNWDEIDFILTELGHRPSAVNHDNLA